MIRATPFILLTSRIIAVAAVTTFLGSCASTQPQAKPYDARDNIANIPVALIIGEWQSTPLNAPSNTPSTTTLIEYRPDGSLRGSIQTRSDNATGAPALLLEFAGSWTTDGEWLRHTDVELKAIGDSPYARQYNQVLNASSQEFGTITNVLELDEVRMITVSKDGRATLYIRQ